jgi:hypothetical protein
MTDDKLKKLPLALHPRPRPRPRIRPRGVLECWSVGVLECWSVGVSECCAKSELHPRSGLEALRGQKFVPAAAGSLHRAESEAVAVSLFRPFAVSLFHRHKLARSNAIERGICFYTEKFETSPA